MAMLNVALMMCHCCIMCWWHCSSHKGALATSCLACSMAAHDGVSASPEQAEPAGTAPPAVSPHPGACPGACPGVSPPPVPPVVSPYINGIEANIMEVLATGDAEVLCRPCVDCGVRTGSYCDWCEAVDRMPSEQWAHGQMTPLCTRCDSIHDECHFCRDLPWCTPPTKPFHTDAAL